MYTVFLPSCCGSTTRLCINPFRSISSAKVLISSSLSSCRKTSLSGLSLMSESIISLLAYSIVLSFTSLLSKSSPASLLLQSMIASLLGMTTFFALFFDGLVFIPISVFLQFIKAFFQFLIKSGIASANGLRSC